MEDLIARWRRVVGDGGDHVAEDLLARWSEPHRRYHDIEHLRDVLDAVDLLDAHAADPMAVRLAAWFHDAVYEGRPGDDESASAALAAEILPSIGVSDNRAREVVRLVELTASHDPAPDDANGAVLCDADLAVLAGDAEAYAAYAAGVREEYADVADEDFRAGREAVLRTLLARDPLFRTPTGRSRWEEPARSNITTELTLLSVS